MKEKTVKEKIEEVRLIKTARLARKLYRNLSDLVEINRLPIKVSYTFIEGHENETVDICKALGVIFLGEDDTVDIVDKS